MAVLSTEVVEHVNRQLENASAQDIIQWAITTLPGLYQTTAFGLTGLVILDLISKQGSEHDKHDIDLVFVDTLHHFKETHQLLEDVKSKYPRASLHVYKPLNASSEEEFAKLHGPNLWETDENAYDFLAKVEPMKRAYKELGIQAVFTGRRKSQGGARGSLPIVEIADEGTIIKINPLANWDFKQVKSYVETHKVPYNLLLDQGYKSIGDYHSTSPTAEGEDERSGRWKGQAKSECGIHETSRFGQYLAERAKLAASAKPQVKSA